MEEMIRSASPNSHVLAGKIIVFVHYSLVSKQWQPNVSVSFSQFAEIGYCEKVEQGSTLECGANIT